MYTQDDVTQAKGRVKRDVLIGIPLLLSVIALNVIGIRAGIRWLVYLSAALMFAVCCFVWGMFLGPHVRYSRFLKDMQTGLTRAIPCVYTGMDEKDEMQDGALVKSVHIVCDADGDERLLYVNAHRTDLLPQPGAHMVAVCYGRHIRSIEA